MMTHWNGALCLNAYVNSIIIHQGYWQCAGLYPLPRMREGLHSGLDCVDWEHEGVLQRPCDCSGKHVLQSTPYIRQVVVTLSIRLKELSCSYLPTLCSKLAHIYSSKARCNAEHCECSVHC